MNPGARIETPEVDTEVAPRFDALGDLGNVPVDHGDVGPPAGRPGTVDHLGSLQYESPGQLAHPTLSAIGVSPQSD